MCLVIISVWILKIEDAFGTAATSKERRNRGRLDFDASTMKLQMTRRLDILTMLLHDAQKLDNDL